MDLVKLIQAEYTNLLAVGASHGEAVEQVGISYSLHREYVEALLTFIV